MTLRTTRQHGRAVEAPDTRSGRGERRSRTKPHRRREHLHQLPANCGPSTSTWLWLAADAKDESLEVDICASRLAVDRRGRNDEEIAGASLDAFGSARAEFDRH